MPAEKFEEAMVNAEEATSIARIITSYDITLLVGENKAVVVNTKHLRLFSNISKHKVSMVGKLPVAVVVAKRETAIIAGLSTWHYGRICNYGYELEEARELIEKTLELTHKDVIAAKAGENND